MFRVGCRSMPESDLPVHPEMTFSAVVKRADGTVVDLGVIGVTGEKPRRWWERSGRDESERKIAAFNAEQMRLRAEQEERD
jgi:hypothetical protein